MLQAPQSSAGSTDSESSIPVHHQPDDQKPNHNHSHGNGNSHGSKVGSRRSDRDSEQDKVRSTLRSFVRDWSIEGQVEREACYTPCLEALERRWPDREERGSKRVLIPGSGLGRLAMEVAARGAPLTPVVLGIVYNVEKLIQSDRVRGAGERIQRVHACCLQFHIEPVRHPSSTLVPSHIPETRPRSEHDQVPLTSF